MDEYGDCDVAKQSTYLLMTSQSVTENLAWEMRIFDCKRDNATLEADDMM